MTSRCRCLCCRRRRENLYHQEVLTLKQQLEQQVREKAQSQAEVEAQQQKLVALNGYIAILEGKQQETEAQTQARLAALEAQLAEKNAELAKQTEQERAHPQRNYRSGHQAYTQS